MNKINRVFLMDHALLLTTSAVEEIDIPRVHAHRDEVLATRNSCSYAVFPEIDGYNTVIPRVLLVPYDRQPRRAWSFCELLVDSGIERAEGGNNEIDGPRILQQS